MPRFQCIHHTHSRTRTHHPAPNSLGLAPADRLLSLLPSARYTCCPGRREWYEVALQRFPHSSSWRGGPPAWCLDSSIPPAQSSKQPDCRRGTYCTAQYCTKRSGRSNPGYIIAAQSGTVPRATSLRIPACLRPVPVERVQYSTSSTSSTYTIVPCLPWHLHPLRARSAAVSLSRSHPSLPLSASSSPSVFPPVLPFVVCSSPARRRVDLPLPDQTHPLTPTGWEGSLSFSTSNVHGGSVHGSILGAPPSSSASQVSRILTSSSPSPRDLSTGGRHPRSRRCPNQTRKLLRR